MPPRKKSQNISGLQNQGTTSHATSNTAQLTTQLTTETIQTYHDSLKIDWSLQDSDDDSDWESEVEEEIEADEIFDASMFQSFRPSAVQFALSRVKTAAWRDFSANRTTLKTRYLCSKDWL